MDLRASGPKKNHKKGIANAAKEQKRKEAEVRQECYRLMTPEQKVARLDAGGFTATKERYKIILEQVKLKMNKK